MFRGVSFVLAVAVFTIITLVSCAGVTHPCVTCNRGPASDPFVQAEEVRWEGMSGGDSEGEEKTTKRRGPDKAELKN